MQDGTKPGPEHVVRPPLSRNLLQAFTTSLPVFIFSATKISIVLAVAAVMELTTAQTSALIFALYVIPGGIGLILTAVYRIPLVAGWSTAGVVFLASVGHQMSYPELLGAMMVVGVVIVLLGALGATPLLSRLVPAPIVFGILGGLLLPFVVRIFTDLGAEALIIGAVLIGYVAGLRLLEPRVPALIPALLAGFLVAGLTSKITPGDASISIPAPELIMPAFSFPAILTVVPIMVVAMSVQGNLPAIVYLESQDYRPPKRVIEIASGTGAGVGALFGVVPVAMAGIMMPVLAGPTAGYRGTRHWGSYASAASLVLIALFASVAAELPAIVPISLLFALAGLALLPVLGQALSAMTRGPMRIGPLFAFAVALSDLSLLGFGSVFWALVIGITVSLLLEPDAFATAREAV